MYQSKNAIVRSCCNHAILDTNSCIGAKLTFLRTIGVFIFLLFLSRSYVMLLSEFHKLELL